MLRKILPDMQNDQDNLFDDPVLKEAVIRALGSERAPVGLADRIRLAMQQVQTDGTESLPDRSTGLTPSIGISSGSTENASNPGPAAPLQIKPVHQPVQAPRYFRLFASIAAAAAIVLVGTMILQPLLNSRPDQSGEVAHGPEHGVQVMTVAQMPSGLPRQILALHDYCSGLPGHHDLHASRNDFHAIQQELVTDGHGPAWVFDLTQTGWHFHGASRCHLGDQQISHLVFDRKDDSVRLSVMTIPIEPGWQLPNGAEISEQVDPDHWIVAFVADGQLFTLVASGPASDISLASLVQMRNTYRSLAIAPGPLPAGKTQS